MDMQPVDFMVDLGLAFVVDWVILVGGDSVWVERRGRTIGFGG